MTRHRMDPGDAAWLHMERPTNRMIVHSVMWFDEPMDWDALRQLVQERMIDRFPHFSQRVVELPGFVWWEDVDELDLDKHLIHATLPGSGDQDDLQRYVSRVLHRQLDLNRPLWEMHLIDGFHGRGSAIVTRIHHCIADGIALTRVMLSLTDDPDEADGANLEGAIEQRPAHLLPSVVDRSEALIGDLVHLAGTLAGDVRHPSRAVGAVKDGATGAFTLAKLLALPADKKTSLRGAAGVRKRVAWTDPLPLAQVKIAARARRVTINDLVLAAISGGVRAYLLREDGSVADVRVLMPVNLRPLDEPLEADLGNRFGLAYLQLPLSIADSRERLATVHQRANAIKHSPEGTVTFGVLDLIGHTPYDVEQIIVDLFADKATAVVTNVPGPRTSIFLAGRKVRGTIGWPPESGNLAMGLSIISYDGELIIGLMADKDLVRDPHFLLGEICREVEELIGSETGAGVASA